LVVYIVVLKMQGHTNIMLENRLLTKMFGHKRDHVVRDCIKLRNEKLHALNSRNITKMVKSTRTRLSGLVARIGRDRNAYMMLLCKPEGKMPLEKHMHTWGCNIKTG